MTVAAAPPSTGTAPDIRDCLTALGIDLVPEDERLLAVLSGLGPDYPQMLVSLAVRARFAEIPGITYGTTDGPPSGGWWHCPRCRMHQTGLWADQARLRAEEHADHAHPGWRHLTAAVPHDARPVRPSAPIKE